MAGDQFASQCKLVTVVFADEKLPSLELFVKAAITAGEYADQMKDVLMFEKEALYFSKLLPDITRFVEATPGYDGFIEGVVPKCYHASESLIVLENMMLNGFSMLDKRVHHNLHTAELVMKSLARFHGVTHAFIQEIGEENFLSQYSLIAARSFFGEEGEALNGAWIQNGIDGAIKILTSKPTPGSEKALEYLRQFEIRAFLKLCNLFRLENQVCSMNLNHGDVWNGNLMFKLNPETKTPESCAIIDFQTIHLGSPAIDLLMYLFLAVDADVRRKHLKNLLKMYYDQLQIVVVQKLGKQLKFSFEDLRSDFRKKCPLGFLYGMYSIFGFEALEEMKEGAMNTDGDAMEGLASAIITSLNRTMEHKGRTFSENIVKMYDEFLTITSEK
jgi:hypothetical protein